ncbi:WRKY transcription factor 22-like [Salvia splendens]|uniref:WRKY transcription factor 22-like n=1 Tax=Salvia splendens TaxID=180675 RepID=UPI001C2684FE|nr:WRKY transcription factor 22-like [Salvia splendens]
MEDDWDLHAIVRGCAAPPSPAAATNNNPRSFESLHAHKKAPCNFSVSSFQDLLQPIRNDVVREDLYKPFFPKSEIPFSLPISTTRLVSQDPPPPPLPQTQQPFSVSNGPKITASHTPTSRPKRRKCYSKKVCHVAAENLSSDVWSWRKYGQKPIKGSPYPRGYYRCSTSKGCMARKQVEQNKSDPGMFIVTYTAEHNHPMPTHRNSLAGSTRHKPAEPPASKNPSLSPSESLSPVPEKLESSREEDLADDDDDGVFSVADMALNDDFFAGLEDFTAPEPGSGPLQFPWLSTSAKTTTTAGGR